MNANLNETPSANRIHIGIFGKRNSGKSSLINALAGQQVSIVSDTLGTTTDPVMKPMEIHGLGPCLLIDTAGFDDEGELGHIRVQKTKEIVDKIDIAIMVFDNSLEYDKEIELITYLKQKGVNIVCVLNKIDIYSNDEIKNCLDIIFDKVKQQAISFSATTYEGKDSLMQNLLRCLPANIDEVTITRDLVKDGDNVLLVMPQDIQAPKGRLILPQVQTIRDLLDKHCIVTCVTTGKIYMALDNMKNKPSLIVCDSQVFDIVMKKKPKDALLTSFSILFSAYKGDLDYYIKSARAVDDLKEDSKILIAECCTHAPMSEDIGRVKIPRMLKKWFGDSLICDIVSGTDFPKDLTDYDLVVQCGGCMFNRKYIMSRIDRAKKQKVAMTNYGVLIAKLTGNELTDITKK